MLKRRVDEGKDAGAFLPFHVRKAAVLVSEHCFAALTIPKKLNRTEMIDLGF